MSNFKPRYFKQMYDQQMYTLNYVISHEVGQYHPNLPDYDNVENYSFVDTKLYKMASKYMQNEKLLAIFVEMLQNQRASTFICDCYYTLLINDMLWIIYEIMDEIV